MDNEPKEEGGDGAIDAPSRETSKKLSGPIWWLVVYALTVDSYLNGSRTLARTLGMVALTLLILKLSVVPLARALYGRWMIERERRRSPEGGDDLPKGK